MPRECSSKNVHRAERGQKIVKKHADRTRRQKCDERGNRFFARAKDTARINQRDGDRQADVKKKRDDAESRPQSKRLADKKWDLHVKAGVERKKMEIKDFRVNRGSPAQQIIGKIIRNDEQERRRKPRSRSLRSESAQTARNQNQSG